MSICDAPGLLMQETLTLLKNHPEDLLAIHKATGVPYHWLKMFKAERIKAPNVNRVEYLNNWLKKDKYL